MKPSNPFQAGHEDGTPMYYASVDDRIHAVKSFTREQCEAALQVQYLQKTVEKAVRARMRKLEREAKWRSRMEVKST